MANAQLGSVFGHVCRIVAMQQSKDLTDCQLLQRFTAHQDHAAFAILVQRHGAMVLGVCRRVLHNHHDAEDAFQATFLVLARKASSIRKREALASWLHGVARRTALSAKKVAARRRSHEQRAKIMPLSNPSGDVMWREVQAALDEAIQSLSDKYRSPFILCCLEGQTRAEAARQLGLKEGTVSSRLAQARKQLQQRFARRGITLSAVLGAAALSENVSPAAVPALLANSTIQAASLFAARQVAAPGVLSGKAVALAEGVLKTMLLTKLKTATVLLIVVAVLTTGAAVLTHQVLAEESADQPVKEKKEGEKQIRNVTGVVKAVNVEKNSLLVAHKGGETSFSVAKDAVIVIERKRATLVGLSKEARVYLTLAADQKTAQRIDADGGPELDKGSVKAVDAEKNTITDSNDRVFTVAKDAEIVIDGKAGKLADVPVGARLLLILSADEKTSRRVNAFGPELFNLTAKTVDAKKNTITDGKDRVFTVTKDAEIVIEGKAGKLADVPPGARFHPLMSANQKTVRRVRVEGPELHGARVKAIDAGKGTVTFDEDKGPAELAGKTFPVPKDATIRIDGKEPGKLTDLGRPGVLPRPWLGRSSRATTARPTVRPWVARRRPLAGPGSASSAVRYPTGEPCRPRRRTPASRRPC
jgi:RNA polymerase sigma factor (sigma-70 family)